MDQARAKEAEECIAKAEKYLKTSLINLKFKPDYDSAAPEFERAGVCYKNAKQLDKSLDCYARAADCYDKLGNLFHQAKCKENAAFVCRDKGDNNQACQLMEAASQLYAESGTSETSVLALDKAAKFFESVDEEKAIRIYRKALDLCADTDKIRKASEFMNRVSRLLIKLEKYDEAVESINQEIELYAEVKEAPKVGKLTGGLVIVQLKRGDYVAAMKSYQNSFRVKGFEVTDEATLLKGLLDSYDQQDDKRFQAYLNRPQLRGLDNEYLKLMKTLRAPGGGKKSSSPDDEDQTKEADEEFEGGLC